MNVIARSNGAGTAAPIANLVSLPLMLLSGYLLPGGLLDIFIWLWVTVVLATRLFKWEVA